MFSVRWAVLAQNLLLNIRFFFLDLYQKNLPQTALWIAYVKVLVDQAPFDRNGYSTHSYSMFSYKYVAVACEYTDLLNNWYSNDLSLLGGSISIKNILADILCKKVPKMVSYHN